MKRTLRSGAVVGALVAIASLGSSVGSISPAAAQTPILQEQGNLQSLLGQHRFSGRAGQDVVISLTSPEFDGALTVLAPDGTELVTSEGSARPGEVAVVLTLPTDGDYTLLARSPFGVPGDYSVRVRVATPYDMAYARGAQFLLEGNFLAAIEALNAAIELDPNQPAAYRDLADAVYGEATRLQPEELEAVVANYRRAADLYEQQGNLQQAQALREQAAFLEQITQGGF